MCCDIGFSIKKEQDVRSKKTNIWLPISIWLYSVQYVQVQLLPYLVMSDHERQINWWFVVGLVGVTLMTPLSFLQRVSDVLGSGFEETSGG